MLTYSNSVAIAGMSVIDACSIGSDIAVVGQSSNLIKIYDTTGTVLNSYTLNNGANSVCALSSVSACVFEGSTMDLVDITNGYIVNYGGGGDNVPSSPQFSAAQPSMNIALAITQQNGLLNKFNGNTFNLSSIRVINYSGTRLSSIIALPTASTWLVGNQKGVLQEIDQNGVSIQEFQLPVQDTICGISYYNGKVFALVQSGTAYVISWLTLELLDYFPTPAQTASPLSISSNGLMLYGTSYKFGSYITSFITDIDVNYTPVSINPVLYSNQNNNFFVYGFQGSTAWAIQNNNNLYLFTTSIESKITKHPSIFDNGAYQQGRWLALEDNGIGGAIVIADITIPPNNLTNVSLPAGKSIISVAIYQSGVIKKGSVARFNT